MSSPWIAQDGSLLAARIELDESSGPVAPAYQFDTKVLITVTPNPSGKTEIKLEIDHTQGKERTPVVKETHTKTVLSREAYDALWRDLITLGGLLLDHKLDEATLSKVGASFNHLAIEVGTEKHRYEYTLAQLKRPETTVARQVIERIKSVAGLV
ncbi:MAG: hypothetical protein U0165_09705 [Polyangiaceae bacterium]